MMTRICARTFSRTVQSMVMLLRTDQLQAFFCADQCFKLRPPGLQPLLVLDFFPLGRLIELIIQQRLRGIVKFQLGQAAFVIDRHRRAVLHGSLDVVDADIIAKHRARILVGQLNGRAGEPDEGCARQSLPHMTRETVNEISNIVTDLMLPPELHSQEAAISKHLPTQGFGGSLLRSEFSCSLQQSGERIAASVLAPSPDGRGPG